MAAAATEAPRSSSSGSADSYISSLISLTSNYEIRYEGVHFNINTEESSIGLRNLRSFRPEGRRKDGPQVPPSDKIYEYILFRGSDNKSHSHYSQAAITSTSVLSGTGSLPDPTSQTSQLELSRPLLQGNHPLYQPGGSLGAWSPSPLPATNGAGLSMPMYWQGFCGPSNGLQAQQPLLEPPPGLSMLPPSMQQSMQCPAMNASPPTGISNLPAAQLSEHQRPLMPPFRLLEFAISYASCTIFCNDFRLINKSDS